MSPSEENTNNLSSKKGDWELGMVGLSHKTAPVEIRELLSFNLDEFPKVLAELAGLPAVQEVVLLCTCNRTEIYLASDDIETAISQALKHLVEYKNINYENIQDLFYSHRGFAAIRHLFLVASSLDSMIVGEPQITAQVKQAWVKASRIRCAGFLLDQAATRAFKAAKRVRSETGISRLPVSAPYAAVELAKEIFGNLDKYSALLVGTGEMSVLAAQYLRQAGIKRIKVVSRTLQRAQEAASKFNGEPLEWKHFTHQLPHADIIITSTASITKPIIKREHIQQAMRARRHRPMFIIDLAVPRDVEPKVNRIDNVYLYDIDDLTVIVDRNRAARDKEAEKGMKIIEQEVHKFHNWLLTLRADPVIAELVNKINQLKEMELKSLDRSLSHLDEKDKQRIEKTINRLTNKIVHLPITEIKGSMKTRDAPQLLDAVRRLFKL